MEPAIYGLAGSWKPMDRLGAILLYEARCYLAMAQKHLRMHMNRLSDEEFKLSMEKAIENNANLSAEAVKAMRRVMDQREEIMEAFVAKYGFEPEDAVQVEFKTENGGFGWMIRKRTKKDPDA